MRWGWFVVIAFFFLFGAGVIAAISWGICFGLRGSSSEPEGDDNACPSNGDDNACASGKTCIPDDEVCTDGEICYNPDDIVPPDECPDFPAYAAPPGYLFYRQIDHPGDDVPVDGVVERLCTSELDCDYSLDATPEQKKDLIHTFAAYCNGEPECNAFNTLGWMKHLPHTASLVWLSREFNPEGLAYYEETGLPVGLYIKQSWLEGNNT